MAYGDLQSTRSSIRKMKLPEKVREWWPLALISGILGGIGTLLTSIYQDAVGPFLAHVLPAVNNKTLLLLCLLLFLVCMLMIAWVAFIAFGDKARMMRNYEHLETRGFWVHRKTGKRVCGNCLIKGIESPLTVLSVSGYRSGSVILWVCGNKDCDKRYPFEQGDIKAD
jgi:hypothetical protein